jgi:alpha-D-xyloside xylohydrolase
LQYKVLITFGDGLQYLILLWLIRDYKFLIGGIIMKLHSFEKLQNGLILCTDEGKIKLEAYADNIIRTIYTKGEFKCNDSQVVIVKSQNNINCTILETEESLTLTLPKLSVEICLSSCCFKWFNENGKILVKEPYRYGKELVEREVATNIYESDLDGKVGDMKLTEKKFRKGYRNRLKLILSENETIMGLGGHSGGKVNRRGMVEYLYQLNYKAPLPFISSTAGWAILADNCSFGIYREAAGNLSLYFDCSNQMDFYFINGQNLDGAVSSYRYLTGNVPMMPKWLFGYAQSKERYVTQQEVIDVVTEYRKRHIPLDLIVQDWQYWEEKCWSEKSFDPIRFPDPEEMVKQIHNMGAKIMISVWPRCTGDGPHHTELWKNNQLTGDGGTYDAFNKDARKTFWNQMNDGIFSKGFDAWWCDASEPYENIDLCLSSPFRTEPDLEAPTFNEEFCKYMDPEFINEYPLVHSQGIYEGQRETDNSKRVVNLTRASYAGQQRYSTIVWSGDINATWETLKQQIPEGLNFCASGMPYWTLDIGGFFVKEMHNWFGGGDYEEGCNDLGYRELYLRWLQYGTFLPMFRSHGSHTPREVWNFGNEGEVFYDTIVKFIKLRYRLIPYIYSLAWLVTSANYTMLRGLAFDFPYDVKACNIRDQFMFGPALMPSPVTEPMFWGINSKPIHNHNKTRDVYLPEGIWYDFWTGSRYEGNTTITANCPLESMPLFVKAGSIIPMSPVMQFTDEDLSAMYEIRIYPGANGSFVIYEDSGDGYDYENNQYSTIELKWNDVYQILMIGERKGNFDSMVEKRQYRVVNALNNLYVEEAYDFKSIEYDGTQVSVCLA